MIAVILCLALLLSPAKALAGAGEGLELCLKAVIPSLLPFMLISTVAVSSGWGEKLGALFCVILKPLFGMDKTVSMCFVTGLLGGYPCGAKAVWQCVEQGSMSEESAQRALAFCNNSGPLFIIGTAGTAAYSSTKAGILLYLCHVAGALSAAAVFARKTAGTATSHKQKRLKLGALVGSAAQSSGAAILSVCSLVITFSSLIKVLELCRLPYLVGLVEVARGVMELGRFGPASLPLAAAYLSWGGLSVHFQTEAVCAVSKKYYYAGKVISALTSGLIMLLCIKLAEKSIL